MKTALEIVCLWQKCSRFNRVDAGLTVNESNGRNNWPKLLAPATYSHHVGIASLEH